MVGVIRHENDWPVGQPLHLWELEFSVFNGSGRALDHLIAYYGIASPWPPCTNWTNHYELQGDYTGAQVQWVDPSGRIQRTGTAMPTLPNQTHTETVLLLAFNGVQPQFTDWSVNYTFMEGAAAEAAVAAEAPVASAPARPSGPLCADTADLYCWLELYNHPDCHVWKPASHQLEIDSWSGQCSDGLGTGTGVYSITSVVGTAEIPYVNGEIHGTEITRFYSGTVGETPWVNGERHGTEILRHADGGPVDVIETPWVNGEIHGTLIVRYTDGDVSEIPYVNSEIHGTEIHRFADGNVRETPYVNGQRHGTRIQTFGSGDDVAETPFVNGEVHGTVIERLADGTVVEIPYVNGEIHGTEIVRFADGNVRETPYVNGQRHGTQVARSTDGTVVETIPYVNGERHGTAILRRNDGTVEETVWVNGEIVTRE